MPKEDRNKAQKNMMHAYSESRIGKVRSKYHWQIKKVRTTTFTDLFGEQSYYKVIIKVIVQD